MLSPDTVNGIFSIVGASFLLNNVRVLMKDKMVRGMSLLSSTFYFGWNVWSLYFYFTLAAWGSFVGQATTVVAFAVYLSLLVYYRWRENKWRDTGWRPSWERSEIKGVGLTKLAARGRSLILIITRGEHSHETVL